MEEREEVERVGRGEIDRCNKGLAGGGEREGEKLEGKEKMEGTKKG